MEYLEGGDLHQAIRTKSMSTTDIWKILDEILSALEYAHEQGIIHRDVKPANILLSADGRAKLTDFDLARAAESSHGTRTGALGTVFYAAPEVHNSGVVLDERSDIYSLAMTAIFALRGKEWTYEEFLRPTRVLNDLRPKSVSTILAKALAVNREHRYSSMTAFREVFHRVMARSRERVPILVRKSADGRLADLMLRAQRASPTYKPACMLSVLDAFEAGEVSLEQLEPTVIFRRFDKILEESAGRGWLPFFHLSTDGFWGFVKDGRTVARDEFVDRRPVSQKNLLGKIDFAVVPENQREWWSDINERNCLRRTLLEMLDQSNTSSFESVEAISGELHDPSTDVQLPSSPFEKKE
jgi:serine/threonine protein kinase